MNDQRVTSSVETGQHTKITDKSSSAPLKVLAVHRYYWPDLSPYSSMLRLIVDRWVKDGHSVEVLSSQPGYKPGAGVPKQPDVETLDGARVRRLNLPYERGRPLIRLINIARFTLSIITHAVFRGKFDVIMVSTAPPVLTGVAARLASKLTGARLIYHCMDVHPEIGRLSGEFSHPKVFRVLQWLDAKTCNHARAVVVLSEDMATAITSRPQSVQPRIKIINNFKLPNFSGAAPSEIVPPPAERDVFRLLFAGNIGRFQGLQHVVEGFRAIVSMEPEAPVQLVLMGEGAAVDELKELAGDMLGKQVCFLPHAPLHEAQAMMRACDAGLISLTPEIYKYAYPSKTMTLLGEGCPLVVAVEPESDLAKFVTARQIGVAVSSDSPQMFAKQLLAFAYDTSARDAMKASIASVFAECFEADIALEQWSSLLVNLDTSSESNHV